MESLVSLEKEYRIKILNDYVPINSGMISLVFKGIMMKDNALYSGENLVIIKIKRNNIDNILQDGIQKMLFCIWLLSFIPVINKYNISNIIHDNIHLISKQTDFAKEVENMKIMKNNCKNLKYIKIPQVFDNKFSNIILMEYIQGDTLQAVDPVDYNEYSKQVIKFVLVTMLMNGLCHGDLHVGNILFIKDVTDKKYKYKIGILDFGIIYEIDKMKDTFYYIFANMCSVSPEEMSKKLLTSGLIEPVEYISKLEQKHYNHILLMLTNFINDTFRVSKHFSQVNIFKSLSELNDYIVNNNLIVNNYNVRPCDD